MTTRDEEGGGLDGDVKEGAGLPLENSIGPDQQTATRRGLYKRAVRQFARAKKWEHTARTHNKEDSRFAEGDSYNGYQWPANIRRSRERDQRPCLTMNRTRQHNLMIINDAKQNKPGIAVRPTGNEATYESAQALANVVRHIEYHSRASIAYDVATEHQVKTGYGVIRVDADYMSEDSMDQDIFIKTVLRPETVYFDPSCKERDKSDAKFAFVFEDVSKEEFDEKYPQYASHAARVALEGPDWEWITDDHIRIAEYFYVSEEKDTLIEWKDPRTGRPRTMRGSLLGKDFTDVLLKDPQVRSRQTTTKQVRWALIIGTDIAAEAIFASKYIPLVPVLGEETIIDGVYDRKGHTRALIDAQRMYNYWTSQAVEQVALNSKSPWVAPQAAIEGNEVYWNTANQANYSVLTYNHMDDEGNVIPPPFKPQPIEMAPAFLSGMQVTQNEMMMVSGQFQSQMGQPGNERSGNAIQQRQRQGDTSTYHYIDNLAIAIRQVGKIVLDMIPRIYDTARVIQAQGEDGISFEMEIDPDEQQAYIQHMDHDGEVAKRVLNPAIGVYEVEADVGPAYATKREQAFDALVQVITQAPELAGTIGDILLRAADFPMAEEAAERLKRMVPPQALGKGPSQNEQALMQQVQQLQALTQKVWKQYVDEKEQAKSKEQLRGIDAYEAETKRMAALSKVFPSVDPAGVKAVIEELVRDSLQTQILPVVHSALGGLGLPTDGMDLGALMTPPSQSQGQGSPQPNQTQGA